MKRLLIGLLAGVMMVLSLASSSWADPVETSEFQDFAKINHIEAVRVFSGLGVISGYEDGHFYPLKPVTRAEMAKMICCLLDADEESTKQGPSHFLDMGSHWADPYVSWCNQEGIISGKNTSTFDPNATVTGVETAKMLLVALGYDPIIEGFTGPTWEAGVLKAARKAGLLPEGSDLKLHTPLTREEAAQMMLNALDAHIVYYDFQLVLGRGESIPNGDSFLKVSNQRLYEQKYSGILQKSTREDDAGNLVNAWSVSLP